MREDGRRQGHPIRVRRSLLPNVIIAKHDRFLAFASPHEARPFGPEFGSTPSRVGPVKHFFIHDQRTIHPEPQPASAHSQEHELTLLARRPPERLNRDVP
jgi:hypothetical protein